MKPRRVLMVAYYFPPIGGVGVQRTLKFVEHLPQAGWEPVVLAPRGARYRVMDPSLLDRVDPDLELYRALCIEPAGIRAAVRGAFNRILAWNSRSSSARNVAATPERTDVGADAGARQVLNFVWRGWVRMLFVPDEQMAWIPVAALAGTRIYGDHPVEVLYSSSPPVSTHLAAGLIKTMTGRPWVADFRDPWIGNSFASQRTFVHERVERWLEQWAISKADRVIFASPTLRELYARRYPRRATRMVTIPNGYDSSEFSTDGAAHASADGMFHLVYTGSMYGERELSIFLDGLALAVDRRPSLVEQLRVTFIGWMNAPNQRLAADRRVVLGPILAVEGSVPHAEVLRRIAAADATLHIIAGGPGRNLIIGSKLFEYIGLDRPVLAIVPRGDARSILAELDWGVIADPEPAAVADALLRLIDSPAPNRRADPTGRYERSRLAARLAEVLDEAATAGTDA